MNGAHAEVMTGEARPRGIKRTQDDALALDDDQRFAKRFHLLNLNKNGTLCIPVSGQSQPTPPAIKPIGTQEKLRQDDYMQLDNTKDRVYIHNLDDELADEESENEKIIFLSDFEKQLSKIPKYVLNEKPPDPKEGQELVLYALPASLSVPVEKDSVRKAILEARQRARDRVTQIATEDINRGPDNPEIAHGLDETDYAIDEAGDDPDAMDIS